MECVDRRTHQCPPFRECSFSPSGKRLAEVTGGEVRLWDLSEWTGSSGQVITGGEEEETTGEEEAIPQTLTKVSGDGQQGQTGEPLANPFVVSVLDQNGSAFAGAVVSFSVTAGGGTLSATAAATDASGRAAVRLTLGSDTGINTVAATVEDLEPVTFTATAAKQAVPHRLTKVCGDDQEGTVSAPLTEPLVVSVSDEDGAAMAGVIVSFAVTAGGGTLSSATVTTNANGRAATRLTLGSDLGTNMVSATVEGLESATFTATGQEDPFASLFDLFNQSGKLVVLPDRTQLLSNAPNPFNSQTVLSYFLIGTGFDALGSVRLDRPTSGGSPPRAAAGRLPPAALGRSGRRRSLRSQRHVPVSAGDG